MIAQYKRIISTSRFNDLCQEIVSHRKMINIKVRKSNSDLDNEYVISGPLSDKQIVDKLVMKYDEE